MTKKKSKKKLMLIPKSTDCFVALFTENGEVKGGNYRRQKITNWKLDNINGDFVNANEICFPKTTRYWGIITHFCLFDKIRNGRQFYGIELHKKKSVGINDKCYIKIGDLDIRWD